VGERNRRLFDLARWLRAVPELAQKGPEAAEAHVRQWWQVALRVIGTKDWDTSWKDFVIAWGRVRRPYGATIAGVRDAAHDAVPQVEGEPREERDILRLQRVCEELQRRHGDRPFPLSCRMAGKLIGVGHDWANQLLNRLRTSGDLQLVTEHDRLRKRGREWRYRMPSTAPELPKG
jgi:hypothetical protein